MGRLGIVEACQPIMTTVNLGYLICACPSIPENGEKYVGFLVFSCWVWYNDPQKDELGIAMICLHLCLFLIAAICHSLLIDPTDTTWVLKQYFILCKIIGTCPTYRHRKYVWPQALTYGSVFACGSSIIFLIVNGYIATYVRLATYRQFQPTWRSTCALSIIGLLLLHDFISVCVAMLKLFLYLGTMMSLLQLIIFKWSTKLAIEPTVYQFYRWVQVLYSHCKNQWDARYPLFIFGSAFLQVINWYTILRVRTKLYAGIWIASIFVLLFTCALTASGMMAAWKLTHKSKQLIALMDPNFSADGNSYRRKLRKVGFVTSFCTPLWFRVGGFFKQNALTFPRILQDQVIPSSFTLLAI